MAKTPITVRGVELMRTELHRLKSVERPAVSQAIADARSHGDLSENAEYEAARERQSFIEGRISDLEAKLGNAQIIDPKLHDAGRARSVRRDGRPRGQVGRRPGDVADRRRGRSRYQVGKISISSPIARSLIGKYAGDEVEAQTPGGVKRYEIVDVRYE
jgi:transcription elongation factor GreA